jgi:hypothetical protein
VTHQTKAVFDVCTLTEPIGTDFYRVEFSRRHFRSPWRVAFLPGAEFFRSSLSPVEWPGRRSGGKAAITARDAKYIFPEE